MAVEYNPPVWTSGDDEKISFFKSSSAGRVCLKGYTGLMQVRTYKGDLVLEAAGEVDTETSEVSFKFSNVSTEIFRSIGGGKFKYDVELKSPSGIVKTELKGYIEVELDVTRGNANEEIINPPVRFVSKIGAIRTREV